VGSFFNSQINQLKQVEVTICQPHLNKYNYILSKPKNRFMSKARGPAR